MHWGVLQVCIGVCSRCALGCTPGVHWGVLQVCIGACTRCTLGCALCTGCALGRAPGVHWCVHCASGVYYLGVHHDTIVNFSSGVHCGVHWGVHQECT